MMMRLSAIPDSTCFHVLDRIVKEEDHYRAQTVSEDWCFGYEAYALGLKVACTRNVKTSHFGRIAFESNIPGKWDADYDYEFGEVWEKANKIEGWLTYDEASLLYRTARANKGPIVEIGAYKGRSTTVLAETGRPVTTIDPCNGYGVGINRPFQSPDGTGFEGAEMKLQEVLKRYPNVNHLRMTATAACPGRDVSFLFIDGDHEDGQPYRDLKHWLPGLRRGATVAFHDYPADVSQDVDRAVSEGLVRQRAIAGTLWVGDVL
jgi:hypothetical protein